MSFERERERVCVCVCVCVCNCVCVCVPCFCWLSGCQVWNDTVANLSLLALGTSAPEILLSVIEVVGNQFVAGELGPGTIVGSAAFNLLVIIGVCMVSIPDGEIRRIKAIKVTRLLRFRVLVCLLNL